MVHGVADLAVSDAQGNTTELLSPELLGSGVPGVSVTPLNMDASVQQLVSSLPAPTLW